MRQYDDLAGQRRGAARNCRDQNQTGGPAHNLSAAGRSEAVEGK
jgi:hypothetical protein